MVFTEVTHFALKINDTLKFKANIEEKHKILEIIVQCSSLQCHNTENDVPETNI